MGRNAETIRAWIEAFNRGNLDAPFGSEETEWVVAREHPAATTHRGAEAIRGYLGDWLAMMPGLRIEVDELLERSDYVLVVGRIEGTGAGSGAAAEVPIATLSTFRDSATSRVEEFLDPAEARAEFERRSGEPA